MVAIPTAIITAETILSTVKYQTQLTVLQEISFSTVQILIGSLPCFYHTCWKSNWAINSNKFSSENLFTVSAISVGSLVWIRFDWLRGPIHEGPYFRTRIILGTIIVWFLVFHVCAPGCSRNGSRLCQYLWVQEKFILFRQITQNAALCPAQFLGKFLNDTSISPETWVM